MPIPAILWSLAAGHGIWYPVNLLAAMATHKGIQPTAEVLESFTPIGLWRPSSFTRSCHLASVWRSHRAAASTPIPGPLAWGGLLMPLFWTALTYGMMGVVNPVLQERVDWPWFVASQFVFGIVAAIVIVRSEEVYISPCGRRSR